MSGAVVLAQLNGNALDQLERLLFCVRIRPAVGSGNQDVTDVDAFGSGEIFRVLIVILADDRVGNDLRCDDVTNVAVEKRRFFRRFHVYLHVGTFVESRLDCFLNHQAFANVIVEEGRFATRFFILRSHLLTDAIVELIELLRRDHFTVDDGDGFLRVIRLRKRGESQEKYARNLSHHDALTNVTRNWGIPTPRRADSQSARRRLESRRYVARPLSRKIFSFPPLRKSSANLR